MESIYIDEKSCCGCGACKSSCPKGIISMIKNEEGFLYPHIIDSSLCIDCKLCQTVCPMHKKVEKERENYYVGVAKSQQVWNMSSSGGVFYEICREFFQEEQGVVFGAKWDGLNVVMDYAVSLEEAKVFCKSKYVAADIGDIFAQVKGFLQKGKRVLFSGTPCQVNGLCSFLGQDRDGLLLVDFACHGQGAPTVFERWIEYLERKNSKNVSHFEFREKMIIKDHVNSNCCSYLFEDGEKRIVTRDYYHHAYVKGLCMRKSCAQCDFAANRKADITLADYKKQLGRIPFSVETKNVSTIIVHTERGQSMVNRMQGINFYEADEEYIKLHNPKLYKGLPEKAMRDDFMREVLSKGQINKVIKKYARMLPTERIEFNCSNKTYQSLYPIARFFDYMYFAWRKIRRCRQRETR